jgi:hypothetical protein
MASILLSTDGLFTSLYKFRFYMFSQPVSMLRKLIPVRHLGWHYRLIMKPNKYLVSVPKRLFGSSASSFPRSVVILTFCVMVGSSY